MSEHQKPGIASADESHIAHTRTGARPLAQYSRHFNDHPKARQFMPLAFVRFPFVKTHRPMRIVEAVWDCKNSSDLLGLYRKTFRAGNLPALHSAVLPDDKHLDNLYLHALSFSLQLAGLTHHTFPVPLTQALQTYAAIRLLRPVTPGQALRFEARTGAAMRREKGVEFSFHTRALLQGSQAPEGGEVVWERTNHFYARGLRYSHAINGEAPNCTVPDNAQTLATWRLSGDMRTENARFLGDFNPMHLNSRLAGLMGSPHASAHPPRIVRTCLAHLPGYRGDRPHQLEVWMKGPVFYHREVELKAAVASPESPETGTILGLYLKGEARPAIVIRLSAL